MDRIEHYLDQVCLSVGGPEELRRHLRQELREHLQELMDDYIATGMAPQDAETRAIESFGEPESVREGLESVHGRRHLAFLIEKAMDWREENMKTGWKWSWTATALVLLTMVVQVGLIWFAIIYIEPVLIEGYHELNASNGILRSTAGLARLLYYSWAWLLAPVVIGWAVFEWRVKNEHKALMRLTGGIAASLALGIVTFLICAGTMTSFALLRGLQP